ncbi:uncharacterized protein N7477_004220 [Penicillium maclennaniae]|uniref:uncharacterized protein n=1 Tax=Penicillium maclennaniae TaxID=1343394 RepID=UPI002540304D|nr:uncharacterized protein N7477_004220 [Penicillium maclennaniae]KAJ5674286.1 hypothetical protein N7477_004220 [Penicillium maclennaniae]
MASSYASLNFDGQMRVDANHAMNPQYAPNSFVNKFLPTPLKLRTNLPTILSAAGSTSGMKGAIPSMNSRLYRIDAGYAEGVYNMLPEKKFDFDDVEKRSRGAEKLGKNTHFCPSSKAHKLLGRCSVADV